MLQSKHQMLFATSGLDYPRGAVSESTSMAGALEPNMEVYVMVMAS